MQIPSLWKVGFQFRPALNFTDEGVRRVMSLMTPAILGTSAVQVNVLVNTYFVSQIEGAQGWLSYAFRLMQFPIGLFGVAIGTASVPVLSRMASEGKIKDFRDTLSSSINLVFLMTIPSAFGLIVLGEPIVRLIYERGAFSPTATSMTALALAGYSIGLAGYAAIKVLSPAFYALNDAKVPMIIGIASIFVNAVGSYYFREWLSHYGVTPETPHGLGHVGVALATSLVALVNFVALAIFMRRKIKRLNGHEVASSFFRIAAASIVMAAVSYASYRFLLSMFPGRTLPVRLVEALVPIALGGVSFLLAAKLLGVSELEKLYTSLRRKLAR
jgi:putative peptidoglycan lipid II flippase